MTRVSEQSLSMDSESVQAAVISKEAEPTSSKTKLDKDAKKDIAVQDRLAGKVQSYLDKYVSASARRDVNSDGSLIVGGNDIQRTIGSANFKVATAAKAQVLQDGHGRLVFNIEPAQIEVDGEPQQGCDSLELVPFRRGPSQMARNYALNPESASVKRCWMNVEGNMDSEEFSKLTDHVENKNNPGDGFAVGGFLIAAWFFVGA